MMRFFQKVAVAVQLFPRIPDTCAYMSLDRSYYSVRRLSTGFILAVGMLQPGCSDRRQGVRSVNRLPAYTMPLRALYLLADWPVTFLKMWEK